MCALTLVACTYVPKPTDVPSPATPTANRVRHGPLTVESVRADQASVTASELSKPAVSGLKEWSHFGAITGVPIDISVAGPLPAEGVRLTRSYLVPLPEGATASFVFYNDTLGAWEAVPSEISADRRSVTAVVHHLSTWTDMIYGSKAALTTFTDKAQQAGQVIKDGAEAFGQAVDTVNQSLQEAYAKGADWLYYEVGKVFDTRVDAPRCHNEMPSWILDVIVVAAHRNNSILFCAGHDAKQPDLFVVKARVNRGFGFTVKTRANATWSYNSTFDGDLRKAVDEAVDPGKAAAQSIRELLDPNVVGPAQEISFGFSEEAIRGIDGKKPIVTLVPPSVVLFLTTTLAELVVMQGMDLAEGYVAAAVAIGSCAWKVANIKNPESAIGAVHRCLAGADTSIAKDVSRVLVSRGWSPDKAGKLAGTVVGKATIYLALIGPVFNAMNYWAETKTPEETRTVIAFAKPPQKNAVAREWHVHGGGLKIRTGGTAIATGHGVCGPPGDWCTDYTELKVRSEEPKTIRLTVMKIYSEDKSGRRYRPAESLAQVGDYYILTVQANGKALTELHAPNGKLRVRKSEANGLGNPWLCPSGDHNTGGECGA
jgi:hypothetical protein